MRAEHTSARHPCLQCTKSFKRADTLQRHCDEVHDDGQNKVTCPRCSQTYGRRYLEQHKRESCRGPVLEIAPPGLLIDAQLPDMHNLQLSSSSDNSSPTDDSFVTIGDMYFPTVTPLTVTIHLLGMLMLQELGPEAVIEHIPSRVHASLGKTEIGWLLDLAYRTINDAVGNAYRLSLEQLWELSISTLIMTQIEERVKNNTAASYHLETHTHLLRQYADQFRQNRQAIRKDVRVASVDAISRSEIDIIQERDDHTVKIALFIKDPASQIRPAAQGRHLSGAGGGGTVGDDSASAQQRTNVPSPTDTTCQRYSQSLTDPTLHAFTSTLRLPPGQSLSGLISTRVDVTWHLPVRPPPSAHIVTEDAHASPDASDLDGALGRIDDEMAKQAEGIASGLFRRLTGL